MLRALQLLRHELICRYGSKKLFRKNVERIVQFYIPNRKGKRRKGLSAIVRVQNEEHNIITAVYGALAIANEVIVVDNNSFDQTIENVSAEFSTDQRVRVLSYPFICFPSDRWHSCYIGNSVFSRAYFYNWCFQQANYQWVWKWDADQIMIGSQARKIKSMIESNQFDVLHGKGVDVALEKDDCFHSCRNRFTSNEPHFFRLIPGQHYYHGERFEMLTYIRFSRGRKIRIGDISDAYFVHLKWLQPSQVGKGWGDDWKSDEWFSQNVSSEKTLDPMNPMVVYKKDLLYLELR